MGPLAVTINFGRSLIYVQKGIGDITYITVQPKRTKWELSVRLFYAE